VHSAGTKARPAKIAQGNAPRLGGVRRPSRTPLRGAAVFGGAALGRSGYDYWPAESLALKCLSRDGSGGVAVPVQGGYTSHRVPLVAVRKPRHQSEENAGEVELVRADHDCCFETEAEAVAHANDQFGLTDADWTPGPQPLGSGK
jgi:hypothetical protein